MKKVLIAVNDKKNSEDILSIFQRMVKQPEDVILLHVERLEGRSLMIDMLGDAELNTLKESLKGTEHKEKLDKRAEGILNYYRKGLENSGTTNVRTLLRDGIPSDEILKVAEEEKVDLIVMGSDNKRGLNRLFTGSVTRDVQKYSKVPVLVAKTGRCVKSFGWREAYVA